MLQSTSLDTPVYAALKRLLLAVKEADPAAYRGMQDELHQAIRSGSYEPGESQLASAHLTSAFKRAAAIAADDAVVDFVRGGMQQFVVVSKTNPKTCAAVASVKPDRSEPGAASAPWYRSVRQVAAVTAIFETSVSRPQSPPSQARIRSILDNVIRDVARGLAGQTQYLANPDLDPRQTCAIYDAIIKRALTLDPDDRSTLLRGMLSGML